MKIDLFVFAIFFLVASDVQAQKSKCQPVYIVINAKDQATASDTLLTACRSKCQNISGQTACQPDRYETKLTPVDSEYRADHEVGSTNDAHPKKKISKGEEHPVNVPGSSKEEYYEACCACSTSPSIFENIEDNLDFTEGY